MPPGPLPSRGTSHREPDHPRAISTATAAATRPAFGAAGLPYTPGGGAVPDLICDTNVFYNIAADRVDVRGLRAAGHRLLLTPVSVLELISHVTVENFADRRAAARAALDHA